MAECDVFNNADFGLTLYLAFDGGSGESPDHVRFKNCPASGSGLFISCRLTWDSGATLRLFGNDVEAAVRTLWTVASSVFYNADAMELEIVVHDEAAKLDLKSHLIARLIHLGTDASYRICCPSPVGSNRVVFFHDAHLKSCKSASHALYRFSRPDPI